MKGPQQEDWVVELFMDHGNCTYSVGRVEPYKNFGGLPLPSHFYTTPAADEIGAFNEMQKALHRLGFNIGE